LFYSEKIKKRTDLKVYQHQKELSARGTPVQGGSPDKKVRTFLKVEVAQASIFLAFKKINKGRKVAQTSIILTF